MSVQACRFSHEHAPVFITSETQYLRRLLCECCSICSLVPGLSKLLLPRINPMLLMGFGSSLVLIIAYVLIDTQ